MVPLTGLEPVLWKPERDFKSRVSTYSTTTAYSVVSLLRQEPPSTLGGMFRRDAPKKRFFKSQKVADTNAFLKPTHRYGLRILSPLCLPFHHAGGTIVNNSTLFFYRQPLQLVKIQHKRPQTVIKKPIQFRSSHSLHGFPGLLCCGVELHAR